MTDGPLRRRAAAALRSNVQSFIVMDVMSEAAALEAAGRSVIHMEVGQPGTPAPARARDAVRAALETDRLGYTLALGIAPLRERLAAHYREAYGVSVPAGRIVVTTGSSGGFVLAFLAAFDVGGRVALPSPGYPCYRQILASLGCRPVLIETGPEDRWMPTVAAIAAAHAEAPLAGLLIASPANPTGTVIEPARLSEIARFCERQGIWLVSDEIYHGLVHAGPDVATALAVTDQAIVINSFSKYFSMTGWRVGWMVVPEALVRVVERLQQNLFISPPAVSQTAALAALDARDELESNRAVYAANRERLLDALPRLGLKRVAPADGAFYLYADVGHVTDDAHALVRAMLAEAGVAATPGIDFDAARGGRFVRFSYAGSGEAIAEGILRLERWGRLRG